MSTFIDIGFLFAGVLTLAIITHTIFRKEEE